MIFSDRKDVTMGKENLQRNKAINITKIIRKQIMETYEKMIFQTCTDSN